MSDGQNTNAIVEILQNILPGLATAFGGPLAGMAAGWLSSKLGVPPDKVQEVMAGMTATDLVKMKELDIQFQTYMADNGIKLQLAQIDVNKQEAASESLFVSGWRPAIGWVCGAGLAYSTIVLPMAEFVSKVVFDYIGTFPVIDWALLGQVMIGMLGLGAMRSYDKKQGTSNGH